MVSVLIACDYLYHKDDCLLTFYNTDTRKLQYYMDEKKELYPYFYTKEMSKEKVYDLVGEEKNKIKEIKFEIKFDSILGHNRKFTKIITHKPEYVGTKKGIRDYFRPDSWQDAKKFYCVYMQEKGYNYGMDYSLNSGKPVEIEKNINWNKDFSEVLNILRDKYKNANTFDFYSRFFDESFPDIPVFGLDIEVDNGSRFLPDPEDPRFPIVSLSFAYPDGKRIVFMLERENMGRYIQKYGKNTRISYFKTEKGLINACFKFILAEHNPIMLTFNGDFFDLPYLEERGKLFDLKSPFHIRGDKHSRKAKVKKKIHIDLYRWFSHPSISNYVYKGTYQFNGLDDIASALLNVGKVGKAQEIVGTNYKDEALYVARDAELLPMLYKKTINIIFMMMRISNTSIEDITRKGINFWHKQVFGRELKRRNIIEPNKEQLRAKGISQNLTTTGKLFEGAKVRAIQGVYTNCTRLDFASLYPTIYQMWNLSWETINCECCKDRTDNRIPGVPHWYCKKRRGIIGELYGFFRDIRVYYFKKIGAKNIEQGLKVFINSAYGVFGFIAFFLFCLPVAESTTAIGRYIANKTWEKAESMGLFVSQADTDSATIDTQDEILLNELIIWSQNELQMELEIEAKIKVLIVYAKKNYICIYNTGKIEIKGMTGKKKHTPQIFKDCFNEIINMIKEEAIV